MIRQLTLVTLTAALAMAQAPNVSTLPGATKAMYTGVRTNILRSAEKMPEEHFAFKPAPEVRTFAGMLGHVADAQYLFCSAALGETRQSPGVEKSKTAKADLIAALKEAFAYCDQAYDGLNNDSALEKVKFFGSERPRVSVLDFNTVHTMEHYGNLVTYMRIKGLVPPSSEPRR